jgi:Leucine-rich repeat (LRR) protein
MEPDQGPPRPDPGDRDDLSEVDMLLDTSSSNGDDNNSDFSNSGEKYHVDEGNALPEVIRSNRQREEYNYGEFDQGKYDDFDNGDDYDDDLSRPDPSTRDYEKPDPWVDGENEFDVENPDRSMFVEDIEEDQFFPSASIVSDDEVQVVEEVVNYPPDGDQQERAPRRGDDFEDEPSLGNLSERTTREGRIITFLSIAVCILILLIVIAIGIGIGISARNTRNQSQSNGDTPTDVPILSPTSTLSPTVENITTSLPSETGVPPPATIRPTMAAIQPPMPSSNNFTMPPSVPSPSLSQPPDGPSSSPPPIEPTGAPAPIGSTGAPEPIGPTSIPAPIGPSGAPATNAPSEVSPTTTPNAEPVESSSPTLQESDLLQLLTENSLDDGEALSTPGTPQNEAYQWLQSNAFLSTYSNNQTLQRYALAVFFYSTSGPTTWDAAIRDDGWVTNAPECEWASTANNQCTNNSYTSLTLDYVGVSGTIPDELSLLSNLERFSVQSSDEASYVISGTIPESIGMLTNMQTLRLNDNDLGGPIPSSIGLLTNARVIVLMGNNLTGQIPSGLANTQARTINLSNNNMTGPIPSELFTLKGLNVINLNNNALTGVIPTEIGTSKSLSTINFSKNDLVGAIPSEIGDLSEIKSSIKFSDNQLSGNIPSEIGKLFRMSECL